MPRYANCWSRSAAESAGEKRVPARLGFDRLERRVRIFIQTSRRTELRPRAPMTDQTEGSGAMRAASMTWPAGIVGNRRLSKRWRHVHNRLPYEHVLHKRFSLIGRIIWRMRDAAMTAICDLCCAEVQRLLWVICRRSRLFEPRPLSTRMRG